MNSKLERHPLRTAGLAFALALALSMGLALTGMDPVSEAAPSPKMEDYVDRYVELFWRIRQEYVHDVDPEEAIYGSIDGMLSTLDPHSSFLDPDTYKRMREGQRGSFSGLGIMVGMRNGKLTVISPIEGTPAYRAGIRSGDVISRIEDEPTRDMTLEESVSKLRGPRGSSVTIQIRRAGFEKTFPITIVRDDIRTRSVEHAFMLRPDVGYIRIKDFNSATAAELDEALLELEDRGMESLLLDLRGNPGGLLDQAVSVSERFLDRGQMVVYTRGRLGQSNSEFEATGNGRPVALPLIVLVDQGSASASEIVAGAIQDHDRGLIVGKRTWGKGLVQSVYSLPGQSAMALTTARYYTPSGRLIQRDYSSFYDYFFNAEDESHYIEGPVKRTDLGREVHGGGGIAPDVEVDPEEVSQLVVELDLRHQALFGFANLLAAAHRARTEQPVSTEEGVPAAQRSIDPLVADLVPEGGIQPGWRPDEEIREAFFAYVDRQEIDASREEMSEAWDQIARFLRREVHSALWGLGAGYRIQIEGDRQVLEALELLPQAEQMARGDIQALLPPETTP